MMMMGFGLLVLLVPLLLIGVVAYALGWRPQPNQTRPAPTSQTPQEILKARYAGGEISREEYDQMLRDLEG
jgi:putative membrane protein